MEDFGGNLPADSKTLIPLFQGVVKREIFTKDWDDEDDLLAEPAILSGFFAKHSHDQILLLKSVFDYLDRVADGPWTNHDVFVIDINLDRYADGGRDLPVDMAGVDKTLFHRKGGIYIYNHLMRNGVPPENICFLSGEAASTLEFVDHCRDALMPRPEAFEKTDSDFPRFREWLRQRQEDPYITLRRAVIEGCEYLKQRVESDDSAIQFREFIGTKGGDTGRATRAEIIDYLNTLQTFLPALAYSEFPSTPDGKRLKQLYRLFVRTLAHEWEDAANPGNLRRDMAFEKKNILRTFGWIMKNVRNWMAHTSLLNELAAEDVAFIFLINMRAMFDFYTAPVAYEKALLELISRTTSEPVMTLDKEQLLEDLVQSYRHVKDQIRKIRRAKDAVNFSEMVNNLVLANEASQGASFLCMLYQMFWHGLSPVRFTRVKPSKDQWTKERILTLEFSFNCDINHYLASPNATQDFIYQLACTIYRRSFPQ
ncbi:hypothetical protein CKO23_22580 [Thiocystis violacea]|nr:hypothetical protein [Thiocystis violacea]